MEWKGNFSLLYAKTCKLPYSRYLGYRSGEHTLLPPRPQLAREERQRQRELTDGETAYDHNGHLGTLETGVEGKENFFTALRQDLQAALLNYEGQPGAGGP